MNRRRFLSLALVPLVPAVDDGVIIGMDWTTTSGPALAIAGGWLSPTGARVLVSPLTQLQNYSLRALAKRDSAPK